MATGDYVETLENQIDYVFKNKSLVTLAFTAAGADEENHHGNRNLADWGRLMIHYCILDETSPIGSTRGSANDQWKSAANKKRHAEVAKKLAFDNRIAVSPRQSGQEPGHTVLSSVVCAVIGAAYQDSGRESIIARNVIWRMGLFQDQTVSNDDLDGESMDIDASSDASNPQNPEIEVSPDFEITPSVSANQWPGTDTMSEFSAWTVGLDSTTSEASCRSPSATCSEENDSVDFPPEKADCLASATPTVTPSSLYTAKAAPRATSSLSAWTLIPAANADHMNNELTNEMEPSSRVTEQSRSDEPREIQQCPISTRNGEQAEVIKSNQPAMQIPSRRQGRIQRSLETKIEQYMEAERSKCERFRIDYNASLYSSPEIEDWVSDLDKEDRRGMIRTFFVAIGTSEAVAMLYEMVKQRSLPESEQQFHLNQNLTTTQRLEAIETAATNASLFNFMERYHVLKLFQTCFQRSRPDGPFVMETPGNNSLSQNRPGNPNILAKADTAELMMHEIHPLLKKGTQEFTAKHRRIDRLRKLGERLSLMTDMFGEGVLGLLPSASVSNSSENGFAITNDMILLLPIGDFRRLLALIDKAQGEVLRLFSKQVENVLGTFLRTAYASSNMERVEPDQILKAPKGSQELLNFIT